MTAIARNIIPKAITPEEPRSPAPTRSRDKSSPNAWLAAQRVAASSQPASRQPATA